MSEYRLAAFSRGLSSALRQVEPQLLVKFELENPGGSHKVRAARYIVRKGVEAGAIIPGRTTVIEKTGGNFGLGLLLACAENRRAAEGIRRPAFVDLRKLRWHRRTPDRHHARAASRGEHVDYAAMLKAKQRFATAHGYLVGNTSAACLAVAFELASQAQPSHKVLTIAYDHGLWYT
jgi:cysteine synthase